MSLTPEPVRHVGVTTMEKGILKTMLYFDIFNYPLTLEELFRFHPDRVKSQDLLKNALEEMQVKHLLYLHHPFYSLNKNTSSVDRRIKGNELAASKLPLAKKYSRLIAAFPFVRAVMLSGSISKNYMDESSDVDYFVVTEPGRLWLTRALLAAFKRVFLLNSRKFFCINYFVDTHSLEIEEKNMYTAFETATLIPVYGRDLCEKFMLKNEWTKNHFPNLNHPDFDCANRPASAFKRTLEKIMSGRVGERLDGFFMKLAISRWRKQYGSRMGGPDFEIAFKSKRNVSKSHPQFFQKRILEFFDQKVQSFEAQHQLKIPA